MAKTLKLTVKDDGAIDLFSDGLEPEEAIDLLRSVAQCMEDDTGDYVKYDVEPTEKRLN